MTNENKIVNSDYLKTDIILSLADDYAVTDDFGYIVFHDTDKLLMFVDKITDKLNGKD